MAFPSFPSDNHASDDVNGINALAKIEFSANEQSTAFFRRRGFPYPKESPTVWVKWGCSPSQVRAEALTQDDIHRNLDRLDESTRKGVRVPEVFRVIETEVEGGWPLVLIVMEYVPGPSMASLLKESGWDSGKSDLYREGILDALNAFLSFQPKKETAPGPEGGGRIEHFVFGMDDTTAPQDFETVEELQSWVNEEVGKSLWNFTPWPSRLHKRRSESLLLRLQLDQLHHTRPDRPITSDLCH